MNDVKKCILYRDFQDGEILYSITELMNEYINDKEALKGKKEVFYQCVNSLVEMAVKFGFS